VDLFRIGVVPARALDKRERLFSSLQQLFPVVFERVRIGRLGDLDGLLVLDPAAAEELPAGLPTLLTPPPRSGSGAPCAELVEFASSERVERALRGRRLSENGAMRDPALPCSERAAVLASAGGRPVWWRQTEGEVYVSAFPIEELREGEPLREQLHPGRFMGLVPLLQFLREVCEGINCSEQPLRASFVIDDPNLHWPSYGFLKYAELIHHASLHSYHAGLAMVPLDGWMVSRRAASLVRANGESLSLLVHGNDHVAQELGRLSTDRDAELAIGQALRRVARFERRSGVRVRRVMAPPHGVCSEPALRAMFRLGFDAACISRPDPWPARASTFAPLVGWHPAELAAGGLPVLPRHHLDSPREELVFRALLRQPLILYGHHWDFADGLDVLAQAVQDVNSLGEVRWGPLDEIAAHNYAARREGDVLAVEMYSRRVRIDVPEGVAAVTVRTREVHGEPLWRYVTCGAGRFEMLKAAGGWVSDPFEVRPPAQIELCLSPYRPLELDALPGLTTKPWPVTRRMLVESRDRVRPLLGGWAAS
jgi:hypothetical protein